MPFDPEIKARMFVRCSRICCLCWKQCGTNIEAAHIIPESEGGPSTTDNGIPVCFDCHGEIGHYSDNHPKGNKFRSGELKTRRDHVYDLVESGSLLAQLIALRMQASKVSSLDDLPHGMRVRESEPSANAENLLSGLIRSGQTFDPHCRKLGLLDDQDRAHVIDSLVKLSATEEAAVATIGNILTRQSLTPDQSRIVAEHVLISVSLSPEVGLKSQLLCSFPIDVFAIVDAGLLETFVEDLIEIISRDRFNEVNKLMPALANRSHLVPLGLAPTYVKVLLDQASSMSWSGSTSASSALRSLPMALARAGIGLITPKYLMDFMFRKPVREFVTQYRHLADPSESIMLADYLALSASEFTEKYMPDLM